MMAILAEASSASERHGLAGQLIDIVLSSITSYWVVALNYLHVPLLFQLQNLTLLMTEMILSRRQTVLITILDLKIFVVGNNESYDEIVCNWMPARA